MWFELKHLALEYIQTLGHQGEVEKNKNQARATCDSSFQYIND